MQLFQKVNIKTKCSQSVEVLNRQQSIPSYCVRSDHYHNVCVDDKSAQRSNTHISCCGSILASDGRSAGVGSMEKLSRCPEDGTGGRGAGQCDKPPKSREEMRELVNTPLPSTWRRSSLPSEEPTAMEELWLRAAADAPVNRVVQTGVGSWGGPTALPVVKSRRESRRSSLNVGPLTLHNAFIDVRKNPV